MTRPGQGSRHPSARRDTPVQRWQREVTRCGVPVHVRRLTCSRMLKVLMMARVVRKTAPLSPHKQRAGSRACHSTSGASGL
jgi:hypothetical protein